MGRTSIGLLLLAALTAEAGAQEKLTYTKHVAPLIKKYCLPCHLAENDNPSQLALDSYELMVKGGEHGETIEPGKPEKSILYQKLLPNPPFGKQMARNRKRLTEEELKVIYDWIAQGAKK